jgi:hypothetical protein
MTEPSRTYVEDDAVTIHARRRFHPMSQQNNPGTLKQEFLDLIEGLTTSPPGGQTSLVVGGTSATVSDLIVELNGYAAAYKAVDDADDAHKTALAVRSAIKPQAVTRRKQIRAAIKGVLGRANPALSKFGMTPDKPRQPLTVEEESLKVAKAKATRAARHTMGKKQKEAIKGEVPPPPAPPKGGA